MLFPDDLTFRDPIFLWGLVSLPLWVVWRLYGYRFFRSATPTLRVSTTQAFGASVTGIRAKLRNLPFVLRLIALGFAFVALARPQSSTFGSNKEVEGMDIVLALDISGSMLARDFTPNRLEAAKQIAMEFVAGRRNDRMGLVVFSGESFTQCPLTTDHAVLLNLFKDVTSGMVADGTAIGMGLASAVNRLKDSQSKSKVIILLTDGVNNQGAIAPLTAAEIAQALGVRVYTIGVGTIGKAPFPVQTFFGTQFVPMDVEIDEKMLGEIASMTGGKYFRATDNKKLKSIYAEIDKLEKTRFAVTEYSRKHELFMPFAWVAVALLVLELILRLSFFRTLP